ncbi:MAG: helix-turn-helix transcriptional regulator [Pirellulales bacterium]
MNLSKISRLVQLLGLLQAAKGLNVGALADACGVSRRTIFRDLDVLRQAGVPLLLDDDSGIYRIPGTYFLPPTNFTAEEALAVLVLCYELGSGSRLPFYEAAASAALKLESSLPGRMRERVRDESGAVHINMQPGSKLDDKMPVYRQLLGCIAARQAAQITYDSPSDHGVIRLKLSPYRLLFSRHSWYVIGRSSIHREVRTFNVGRIQSLELVNEAFDVPRGFSVERYLGNAWHLIPEPGRDHSVVVHFSPLVARNVGEVVWHKTQRLVRHDDGSLDFHVRVSGLNEISWWILGYGDQAEVLRPARLRQIIAQRAARLVDMYNGHA